MRRVVRLCEVRLDNFKNTAHGVVTLSGAKSENPFEYTSSILGIYGQNGSGKTAVVEALAIIRRLLSTEGLKNFPIQDYIMNGKETCTIGVQFLIEQESEHGYLRYVVDYDVSFARTLDKSAKLKREILRAEKDCDGKKIRGTLIDYDTDRDANNYLPKYRYNAIAKTSEGKIAVGVAQRIASKENTSFMFAADFQNAARDAESDADEFKLGVILDALYGYGSINLFVITSAHSAMISLNVAVPVNIRIESADETMAGTIPLMLSGPEVVSNDYYELITKYLDGLNGVLKELIPGLTVGVHNYGQEMLRDGKQGVRIEIESRRGDSVIPLKYESEGIIKIVSILHLLICVYRDASTCLVIDELDSGIFEYLLGELLIVMKDNGKGQIIFTSHNLRPLEMLDKTNIMFSTTNPENRYIHMQYVKQNNNLRDLYLRSILLGGQKEELYEETDTSRIVRAFRRAGKAGYYGENS